MRALWSLNPYFWKYKWHFAGGVMFILLTNVFAVYAPALIGEGVNVLRDVENFVLAPLRDGTPQAEVFQADSKPVSLPTSLQRLAEWTGGEDAWLPESGWGSRDAVFRWVIAVAILQAALYVLVYLIKGIFLFFTRQTIIVMSRHIEFDLKARIFDKYQILDAGFYKQNDTGDLMNRISEDVSQVRMYLGPAVMYTLNLAALIALTVSTMLYIDLELTFYVLLPLPLMSLAIYRVSSRIHEQSTEVQERQSAISTFVQQHIGGIRILQSFHREADAAMRFTEASEIYKTERLRLVKTEAMFMPIIVLLVGLSTILTIYIGGLRVIDGALELGHIFQFVFYVNLLTWPFASVGWVTSLVQKAEASMSRINEFMLAEPDVLSGSRTGDADPEVHMVFDHVGYVYPETGIEAVRDLSFELRPGKTLAITGRTGSGKSTVAQLAMRIFDPTSGEIRLQGEPLATWDLEAFRSMTGYVPQEVFLFSDEIGENIAFGLALSNANELETQIEQAAKDAHVAHNIEGFPKGYATLLGERGVNLSGGQKQRISIARALIRKPQFLILDDCLSAVDTETEEHILEAIANQEGNPAVLIVSHRISSIRHADEVVVLDGGHVVEQGAPADLLAQKGLFFELSEQSDAQNEAKQPD